MSAHFQILCDGEEIGTSRLEQRDPGMGTASGLFAPSPAYDRVRHVFRLFSEAQSETEPPDQDMIARYYQERDKLNLTVARSGGELVPTSVVHISDFSEGPDDNDSYEVEVHVDDSAFFRA